MDNSSPFLDAAADPLIIIDQEGNLAWKNKAFDLNYPEVISLSQLLERSVVTKILGCPGQLTLDAELRGSNANSAQHSLHVLDVGSNDPGSGYFLISIRNAPSEASAMREREDFLATVMHDLKNPIGAVFGYADTLLDTQLGKGLNSRQSEILSKIRNTAARALELLRNFQHLMDLESGRSLSSLKILDLNSIVTSVVDATWRDVDQSAELEVKLSPEKLNVAIEPLQLERIVSNLLSNALKYTPAGGKVRLTTSKADGHVVLSIYNQAVIPEDERTTIFERHKRGSAASGIPGSGLGLYIVKRALKNLGGEIKMESSAEAGTTFTVTFKSAS